MQAIVSAAFRDRETWRAFSIGETYEGTRERIAELAAKGFVVDGAAAQQADASPDYASMTNAQLKALCKERGLDYPTRATKAQLVGLLEQ